MRSEPASGLPFLMRACASRFWVDNCSTALRYQGSLVSSRGVTCGGGCAGPQAARVRATRNAAGSRMSMFLPGNWFRHLAGRAAAPDPDPAHALRGAFQIEVNHRRDVERDELREEQTAHYGKAERLARVRAGAGSERDRQGAEERRHRGHHDRPETQNAARMNGIERSPAFVALGFNGEIDHHDRVLLDYAEQHDQPDKCVEV